jgi:hypothetical protein
MPSPSVRNSLKNTTGSPRRAMSRVVADDARTVTHTTTHATSTAYTCHSSSQGRVYSRARARARVYTWWALVGVGAEGAAGPAPHPAPHPTGSTHMSSREGEAASPASSVVK